MIDLMLFFEYCRNCYIFEVVALGILYQRYHIDLKGSKESEGSKKSNKKAEQYSAF